MVRGKIAIVGSGFVGQAWAILFARRGYSVALYDADATAAARALSIIVKEKLPMLLSNDLLQSQSVEQVAKRISTASTLKDAISGAYYVQESVPENLEIKRKVFKQITETVAELNFPADKLPILGSSSSTIAMTQIAEGLKFKELCIVSHPVNPPFTIPVVEVVPSIWTLPEITKRTRALLEDIGQAPVTLLKECPGFLINRLQYAILAEAFRIVEDGLASPEDVDACISNGLARRWVFMGPFQTIDLNAPKGVQDYCQRYSKTILDIVESQDNSRKWSPELIAKIDAAARKMNGPVKEIPKALAWRDDRLARLQSHLDKQASLSQFNSKL
eukprot:TRINITY_DN3033_c0_g2_i1.p2 TRINITY_DN3033_c0_g2~~TRINITY_DN3033_c0_g2_i1.p2  ORF type:complete len:331 (-),score=95.66 TRINITY_DN3033_c0_g2_i1:1113-2105(-)